MFTFHHVLFPVDFSSGCQALAPTVRRMVEVWSVDVTLLHAIDEERWLGARHELERLMRQMKAIAGDGPQARYFGFRLERGQPDGQLCPVTAALSSAASHSTSRATSSGRMKRFSACAASTSA